MLFRGRSCGAGETPVTKRPAGFATLPTSNSCARTFLRFFGTFVWERQSQSELDGKKDKANCDAPAWFRSQFCCPLDTTLAALALLAFPKKASFLQKTLPRKFFYRAAKCSCARQDRGFLDQTQIRLALSNLFFAQIGRKPPNEALQNAIGLGRTVNRRFTFVHIDADTEIASTSRRL